MEQLTRTPRRRRGMAINRNSRREELEQIVRQEGRFVTLAENVRRLVLEGTTTIEEARRVTVAVEDE